jgi:hypothetical protein
MLVTLKIHTVAQNIISLLKNAPALKRLSFCPGITSFSDLNTIHTSLIDLESLEIRNSTIEILGFDEITDPATSIVECIFLDVTLTVPKNIWEYIDQKYPNVSSISCNCYRFPFTTMIFDQGIYDGWMKLFQGLKSQLKRISHFDEATDQDIFEVMDIQNCGLDYLQLVEFRQPSLQKLIVSSQVLSLETLVLRDTSIDSYEWLSHLQPIRKFKLICPVPADQPLSPILNLNDVLDNCPSQLVSLTINSVAITGDIRSSTPTNIKSLSFVFGTLPINIDESISIRFPKLSKLKLKSCNLYERKFNLSKLSLASFHYNDHYFATDGQITGDCKVLISTLDNLEQRLYEFKAVHDVDTIKPFKTFSEYLKFSPMHETDAVPTFTMVCNSLGIFNSS